MNWVNKYRSRCGKENGIVKNLWEDWRMKVKQETSKNNYKREKKMPIDE